MSLLSSSNASGSLRTISDIEIADGLDERIEFQIPAHAPARMKILADTFAQIERLADVDDGAEAVLVQIHAGLVRHSTQFCLREYVLTRDMNQKLHAKLPRRKEFFNRGCPPI